MKHRIKKAFCSLVLTAAYLSASGLHAAERGKASEALTANTNEFLSDPARTGSLVGSILAGSAVANPLAPLLGSMAGFMIGKKFGLNHEQSNAAFGNHYARRNLTPTADLEITGLSGLSGKTSQSSEHTVLLGMPVRSSRRNEVEFIEPVGHTPASELPSLSVTSATVTLGAHTDAGYYHADEAQQTVKLGSDGNSIPDFYGSESTNEPVSLENASELGHGSTVQRQLAHKCRSVSADQPMSSACYYFFQ